jgi:hypothetical protein
VCISPSAAVPETEAVLFVKSAVLRIVQSSSPDRVGTA